MYVEKHTVQNGIMDDKNPGISMGCLWLRLIPGFLILIGQKFVKKRRLVLVDFKVKGYNEIQRK